jgi:Mor family transcriptional regulator
MIDSLDSFRTISLRTWNLFKSESAKQKYFINDKNDDLKDWEAYSEVKNMRSPCDLISCYDKYTDDQIEELADKLDDISGQNYFNTLYQLLGDKFLAFLDVFQEDKISIPSTAFVKHLLTDMSICSDYSSGLSVDDLATKYNKSSAVIDKIVAAKEVL